MCPLGIGKLGSQDSCRYHVSEENLGNGLCPIHKLPLEKTTNQEDKIRITIISEDEVDNFIKFKGDTVKDAIRKEVADSMDEKERDMAAKSNRTPVIRERQQLSIKEKTELKDKIKRDIDNYKKLEDK